MEIEDKKVTTIIHDIKIKNPSLYLYIKRLFDMFLSFIGLVMFSGIFLIVAIIIKKNDFKGSVFFKQKRIGKNGKPFNMYKFRSMYSNAEERLEDLLKYNEVQGAMFKIKNDPRVTPVGRYLRKYSIDELPQLLNVLKGDMSLVGPRPPIPREVEKYTAYDMQRLSVTPGITGLWQVSGRSSLSFQQMIELDLIYIKKLSLRNDLKILFKTLSVVINTENAY